MWQTCRSVVLLSNIYKPVCFSDVVVALGFYYYMLSTRLLKLTTTLFFKLTIFCRKHCIIMQIIVTTCHNVVNILRSWNICLCNLFAFVIMPQIYSEKKSSMKIPLEPFPSKNLRTTQTVQPFEYVKSTKTFFNHRWMNGSTEGASPYKGQGACYPRKFWTFYALKCFF